jgi:4-hydroxy-tetrahydrodipicolinate reductase
MNIALIGYGKMGKEIERIAKDRRIAVKKIFDEQDNLNGRGITKESLKGIDVCIEFSSPAACVSNIKAVAECGVNIVVGTTGWYERLDDVKRLIKSKKTGLLYSPNFSLGMNVFAKLVSDAAQMMDKLDMYDAALHEIHHKGKADSPSGTALMLGQTILQQMKRKKEILQETSHKTIKPDQLHITSARVGNVVGKHQVMFDSEADTIELTHNAKNRTGFALGALVAAEWLKGKKGVYTMNDVMASL